MHDKKAEPVAAAFSLPANPPASRPANPAAAGKDPAQILPQQSPQQIQQQ